MLQKERDLPGAENIYRAILKQHANHFHALSNLGLLLLDEERIEEAIKFLRKALSQKPNSALVHARLARAFQISTATGKRKSSFGGQSR